MTDVGQLNTFLKIYS